MRLRLGRFTRGAAVASLAVAAWSSVPSEASAQRDKAARDEPKASAPSRASNKAERASGVITKVEAVTRGDSSSKSKDSAGTTHRLTINTNAVWRDWARDQAQMTDTGSAKKDAAKGKESVATRGEPADANSLIVVNLGSDTQVETRFRAPDDESSKGSKTPETPNGKATKGKPVEFKTADLKPGLFVEVDFKRVTSKDVASTVTVIRPIGGPDSGVNAAGKIDRAK